MLTPLPAGYELAYTRRAVGFELHHERDRLLVDKVVKKSATERVGNMNQTGFFAVGFCKVRQAPSISKYKVDGFYKRKKNETH